MICAIVFVADLSHCVSTCLKRPNRGNLQSGRFHGILKKDKDNAATKIGSYFPGSIARPTSSWPEVNIEMTQFLYLGGVVHESADLLFEIAELLPLLWACLEPLR